MPHRAHLFSIRIACALRECLNEHYTRQVFFKDLLAGITVGIIAIPLAMALAISSGVAPQYGLYTAAIAGFIIALTGGSRYTVCGPTAAFVVILAPIAHQFGLAGLLVASWMAGFILILMALARLGRFIEYIPESVTLGFTAGIGIVIATLQIKDFFGLPIEAMPELYVDKIFALSHAFSSLSIANTVVGLSTLAVLMAWPRLKLFVPGHIPAILIGLMVAALFTHAGYSVDTIGSRFENGIPAFFPSFAWPWDNPGAHGEPIIWSWGTIRQLLPEALSIAMLGAIESLLCAVVLDNMSGKRHSANSELLGLGLGNVIAPFFGGFGATAAIARSAANFRAGAQTPIASAIHAIVVLLSILLFARWLNYLPMASMAALLLMVAWNIAEVHRIKHIIKTAPWGDIIVLFVCLSLTVLFDMVLAISVGIVLASLIFVREIAAMTKLHEVSTAHYKINGPLFFAAADRIFSELTVLVAHYPLVRLSFEGVSILDAGGISSLTKFIGYCQHNQKQLTICEVPFPVLKRLVKAHIEPIPGVLEFQHECR
ncbi:MAG: C4-dicarboxylic acid transporter DauA [Gammaproteobacteria bacterium]